MVDVHSVHGSVSEAHKSIFNHTAASLIPLLGGLLLQALFYWLLVVPRSLVAIIELFPTSLCEIG